MIYFGRVTSPWIELFILFNLIAITIFILQIRKGIPNAKNHKLSFNLSFIASLAPIIHLLMGLWLFTFSHCHPTHQLSIACKILGLSVWDIWISFWLFALFWHGASFLLLLVSSFYTFKLQKAKNYFKYQMVVLVLLCISSYCLLLNFPDA